MKLDSPYRPSSGPFGTTFPQGKANLRRVGTPRFVQAYTPSGTFGATSPYTPGGNALPVSAYRIRRIGACRRPYKAPPGDDANGSGFSPKVPSFSVIL